MFRLQQSTRSAQYLSTSSYRLGMFRLQLAVYEEIAKALKLTAWACLGCNSPQAVQGVMSHMRYRLGMFRLQHRGFGEGTA